MKSNIAIIFFVLLAIVPLHSQEVVYPYKINYINVPVEGNNYKMAYMDIKPDKPNGRNIILFHGKNFNGYYWKDVIKFLSEEGYRVIVPDQIGWGKSDRPDVHYSFHMLALNTALLLDSIGINNTDVIGHSMGGMLAVRFCLMFPQKVQKLILENPIGLEDYKTFVPYQTIDQLYENERKATYESYKKYQMTYYPEWKPEYEQYVMAQAEALEKSDFKETALANALTYQMIYEQPVCYEFNLLKLPVLPIIGQYDRTILGKNLLTEDEKKNYGVYPALGKLTQERIADSKLVELNGVGHIPHIQDLSAFRIAVEEFLK